MSRWLVWSLLIFGQSAINGQCDYTTIRYQVENEQEVFYGVGTTFDGQEDSLFLDIYKPINDNNSNRPLVVWCFGGGFIGGQRQDFAVLCEEMASRGYVAATIDYRLGYVSPDFLPTPFAFDDNELPRAAFRAMQDLKGAIRFLKGQHVELGIDLNEVYVGGGSAGAITALAATFLRKGEHIDSIITGALPPTNTNPPVTRPALGPIEGELHVGEHDASVQGVVNIFGALFDVTQIEPTDTVAVYSYHQTGDPIVPCERRKAYWGFPFVPDNMPFGSGSCVIDQRLEDIGYDRDKYYTWIHEGNDHALHDQDAVFLDVMSFLEKQICGGLSASDDITKSKDYTIRPNPASDRIIVDGKMNSMTYQILSSTGQSLKIGTIGERYIDVQALPNGQYFLRWMEDGIVLPFSIQR